MDLLIAVVTFHLAESKVKTAWLIKRKFVVIGNSILLRRDYRLKIPDAVIAASALVLAVPLISADTDFDKVDNLNLVSDITR